MKNNKAVEWLRVVIFTFLANLLAITLNHFFPEMILKNNFFIMMTPLAAHVLTRLITRDKADTEELMLHAHLKGSLKYYAAALWFPFLENIVALIIVIILYTDNYRLSDYLNSDTAADIIIAFFFVIGTSATVFVICLGEEYGWRAYLTPKLEKLVPEPVALILSGIIWGLWHAPVIRSIGLNFGKGYKFFPYAGYAAMAVSCIFFGSFLTWVTKKSGSVYPAAICHTLIDSMFILSAFLPQSLLLKSAEEGQFAFNFGAACMSGAVIVGSVFFVILCRDSYREKHLPEKMRTN